MKGFLWPTRDEVFHWSTRVGEFSLVFIGLLEVNGSHWSTRAGELSLVYRILRVLIGQLEIKVLIALLDIDCSYG